MTPYKDTFDTVLELLKALEEQVEGLSWKKNSIYGAEVPKLAVRKMWTNLFWHFSAKLFRAQHYPPATTRCTRCVTTKVSSNTGQPQVGSAKQAVSIVACLGYFRTFQEIFFSGLI